MGRQQHCAASKSTLQKYCVSQVRQKRSSSSSCKKDIAPKKKRTCFLLEPELNISSSLETKKKSKENHQKTLVKSELKNLIERDGSSAIVVECQEAVEETKKCSVSEPEPLQKSWYLRKTIGSTQPEQESFRNEDKSLGKNCKFSLANLRLVKPQGKEQTLQQKCKRFSMELTQTKSCEDLQVLKQNHGCLLKSVVGIEGNKKCRSIVEKERHGMVTRALLKSMIHENNSEKLHWKQENHVATEIPQFRHGVLEKQMTIGQVVDSAPTESRVIPRVTGCSDKQMQGNDELVTSRELKIKIKTSRKQKTEVSDIPYKKLTETDQNISEGCSLPKLLEQSEYLQKTKLGETEYKDPVSCCLGREATLYCGESDFPGTNCRGPQLLDIKITENQVGKDPLVVYQNDKLRCLTKLNEIPCRVIKNPVVKLLDCRYIKALLNPSSDQTIQSYKLHCEFPHVALDQKKNLCLNKGMGQNDLSCNSDTGQAGGSLSQTVLVAKGMCQKKKMSPRFQNGNKRFRHLEFQKISKRMKITEDLEKSAIQGVISNRELYNEYKPQRDPNATTDSSIITEELKYDETVALPSLDVPDFILKKHAQKHPDHLVTLPGNKQEIQSHFTPYDAIDFEMSAAIMGNDTLESKSLEPHTDFSSTVKDDSVVEIQVDERITNYGNNIAGYMQGGKPAPRRRTVNKTGKKQQFSCQRIVPFLGKRIWPIESCARTSWFCKNHVSGSEFLRGTDSFANTSQEELCKPSIDTSKVPANKTMDCETELSVKSPLAESQLDKHKTASGTGNKNAVSSADMERREQCLPRLTKKAKKYKITLNSSVKYSKKEENMVKTNVSPGTQNGIFVDSCKSKAKALVSKQETSVPQVPKTLSMGNLSNFKIPLLKNTSVLRKGRDHHSTQSALEHSASSVKKDRNKVSSDSEHLFHSDQSSDITVAAVEEHTDKFDSSVAGSFPEESSVCNKDLATSLESDVELSALKDISNSLNIGYTKKPTESSVISSESYGDNWNNILSQNKDKLSTDVLKAYEDDALVIDVIQDDPDLFGSTDELEVTDSKEHVTDYCNIISSEGKLMLKSESSPLLRSNLLKFSPSETQAHDTLKSTTDVSASLTEVDENIPNSLSLPRGTTELSLKDEQLTELKALSRTSDSDVKNKISEVATVKEKADIQETKEIENAEHQRASLDQKPELSFPSVTSVAPQWQGIAAKPWLNDFRFSWRGSLMPSTYPNCCGSLKVENNAAICFGLILPHGYCRSHFGTLNGCNRLKCRFAHVPEAGSGKLCNEILKKYISIGEVVLLQRAVHIFTEYYRDITHGMQLDSQTLNDLLRSLLQYCLLKELFNILHTCILIKVLPDVDVLLKVFESVASMKLKEVVPELITISSKLADIGMVFEYEHFGCISKFFNQLQVSGKGIDIFMSRFQARHFPTNSVCDFRSAIAEFQRCKDKGDWTKLGVLFVHVRRGSEKFNFEKCSLFVANILINTVKEDRSGVAFCEFAAAVNAMPQRNEADKTLLGRIGISVLYAYYEIHEWLKARKILDTLHALRIHFTYLKGLIGRERFASRCEIVNVAVQVFLNSGSLSGAVWILKQSGWVINTVAWPCDKMDVLKRHNLLCTIASQYMIKNSYAEAFEVFQNLPGFQNSGDSLDVAQYSLLFNNLLRASTESKILGISSAVIDFMLAKNIPVDFQILRAFITELGRSDLWPKARTYYRSALALGCYPPLEGNLYHKNLLIPSYVTEIEMLLAIEVFLVSNASSIQSPGASNQILQIILKRCKGKSVRTQDEYQSAVERLSQAIQLATPKLSLKPLTVNVNQEQVYSLEHIWVLKWLKENMKWAGKVWLFQ
ncbi:protein TOPAZ1 [Sphaerodactylus townsendi]|uniref:protein TOPAZ1 n=1 Tax=Sphaerodactylus townsendi TaxID=933632 RepID=UPI002027081E|nr:protein TOPAZ1 [Sphaerodactylus townsendi]